MTPRRLDSHPFITLSYSPSFLLHIQTLVFCVWPSSAGTFVPITTSCPHFIPVSFRFFIHASYTHLVHTYLSPNSFSGFVGAPMATLAVNAEAQGQLASNRRPQKRRRLEQSTRVARVS
jgi:hypothetical protein